MATATSEIHVSDIGTILQVTFKEDNVVVDISSASVKTFVIQRPDGTQLTPVGVFSTDGTDGILNYVTVNGDLNQAGEYQIQGVLTLTAWTGKSSIGKFQVKENL